MSRVIRQGEPRLADGASISDVVDINRSGVGTSGLNEGSFNLLISEQRHTATSIQVIRPDDFLVLGFDFVNLEVVRQTTVGVGPVWLERANKAADAFIVVRFPPQHVAEQSFYQSAGTGFEETQAETDAGIKYPKDGEAMQQPARAPFRRELAGLLSTQRREDSLHARRAARSVQRVGDEPDAGRQRHREVAREAGGETARS